MDQIVLLGGGGDASVIAEAIRQASAAGRAVELVGFLDDGLAVEVHGKPVFGALEHWDRLPENVLFMPALQKVRDMPRRAARIEGLAIPKERWANLVHPAAVVASDCVVGAGVYVAACATIQPGCRLGNFSSVRGGAAMGHGTVLGPHAYLGPNATLCGGAELDAGAHLGPNGVVLDGKRLGRFSVAGIASAVTRDVAEFTVVMGNPARRIGRVKGFGHFIPSSNPHEQPGDGTHD